MLCVEYDRNEHTGFTYLTIYATQASLDLTWRDRLRFAWSCLKGKPYSDQLILSKEELANLVDHLIEIQNKQS